MVQDKEKEARIRSVAIIGAGAAGMGIPDLTGISGESVFLN